MNIYTRTNIKLWHLFFPTMIANRLLSLRMVRLVKLGTVMKEFQTPLSPLTPRHPERTTNGYDKVIDTGTDRKLV